MSWEYGQRSGEWVLGGIVRAIGYSGAPPTWGDGGVRQDGRNNPDMQEVAGVGPIPRGAWAMVEMVENHPTLGAYCIRLEPMPGTETFGRDHFWVHGESVTKRPHYSSHGCPVVPGAEKRRGIWESGDRTVVVVRGDEPQGIA